MGGGAREAAAVYALSHPDLPALYNNQWEQLLLDSGCFFSQENVRVK